jgi:Tol biopolymer transport system component
VSRAAGILGALVLTARIAAGAAGPVELVSRIDPGQTFDTAAGALDSPAFYDGLSTPSHPCLSADGRHLAFVSMDSNLAPGQQEVNGTLAYGQPDVFLQDLLTGATKLVSRSVASASTTGNGSSGTYGVTLSADGRWVAFGSEATDLVPGQPVTDFLDNGYLFLFDAATETMTLVATTHDDNGDFEDLALSADGRYLTFSSRASDILPGQPYDIDNNVYLYDRVARKLRLVDHKRGFPNLSGDGFSVGLGISADGRYVLYTSAAGDLVAGQRPNDRVFLYDRVTDTSVGAGSAAYAPASAVLSADGKYVLGSGDQGVAYLYARETRATTLLNGVASPRVWALSADGRYALLQRGDADNSFTLMIYDRVSRAYTLLPRPAGGLNRIAAPSLTADGRHALFLDAEAKVVPGQVDHNTYWDLFLFDRTTGKTVLVSRSAAAGASPTTTANAFSSSPAISANGSRVVFSSAATDLMADIKDLNDGLDVFSYAVDTATTSLVTRHAPDLPPLSPEGESVAGDLSADGRWVAFESRASHLVEGQVDTNGKTDVFLYDRTARRTILVSRSASAPAGNVAGNGSSIRPALSADGRYVSFLSQATDLAPGSAARADFYNLYVFDRIAGAVQFVAHASYPESSITEHTDAEQRISADGNWVAFTSRGDDLVPGQHQNVPTLNVFLWSRETGGLALITRSSLYAELWTAYGASRSPAISADGRFVAFRSTATDLIPGQTSHLDSPSDTPENIFLYDRGRGGLSLVSHGPEAATAGASVITPPSISADGRFVVFESRRGDLDPSTDGVYQSLYLYDRTLGTNRWLSLASGTPVLSADGRTVAFVASGETVPGSSEPQYYLYDLTTGTSILASPSRLPGHLGSSGNRYFFTPALSAGGRYLAFSSEARDLIPGQIEGPLRFNQDLFLFDRVSGNTALISRSPTSALTATGSAWGPLMSADGRRVAFTSDVSLAAGDLNQRSDAYLFDLEASTPGGPVTLPPCTLFDGPAQRSNVRKVLAVTGTGSCGVPSGASRVTVKVTALQGTAVGNLRLYPGNVTAPPAGTLRFVKTKTASATFDLPLATNGAGTIAVLPFVRGNGTVRVVVEVDGYTR